MSTVRAATALLVAAALSGPAEAPGRSATPAELRVTEVSYSTTRVGEAISFTVRNVGDRRAARARVRVYLSEDAGYSSDDEQVLTLPLPRIAGHRQAGRITNRDWRSSERMALTCVTAAGQRRHCLARPS